MAGPIRVVLIECGSFNPITNMHLRMFELARDYLNRTGHYFVVGGIISPVNDQYGKKDLLSATHRCAMVELALQSNDWIRLDTWESNQDTWLETRKVLTHHQQQLASKGISKIPSSCIHKKSIVDFSYINGIGESNYSDTMCNNNNNNNNPLPVQLKLLCGADLLESFSVPGLWKDEDIVEIVKKFGLVVVTREGCDPSKFIYKSDLLYNLQRHIHIVTEWIPNEVSSTRIRCAIRRGESVKYLIPDLVLQYITDHQLFQKTTLNLNLLTPSPNPETDVLGPFSNSAEDFCEESAV